MMRNAVTRIGVLGFWSLMVACSGSTTTLNRQKANQDGGGNTTAAGGRAGDEGGLSAGGSGGGAGGSGGADGGMPGTGGDWGGITTTNKLDLLILVDNSSSMSDKQDVLAQTLPDLVSRLGGVQDLH